MTVHPARPELACLEAGSGVPVLLLHGNFASSAWWQDLLAAPPRGAWLLAPDLPGFAGSAAVGESQAVGALADLLEAWMRQRGLGRPLLVGHSLGGAVAMELAARDPRAYRGLLLLASCPCNGLITPEENYPVLELMRHNPALREASLSALFPSGRPANFAQLLEDAARMHPRAYSGNARALEAWSVDPARLRLPLRVLGGELDRLITPAMTAELGRMLGASWDVLPGVGHGFPQERPLTVVREIEVFLKQFEGGSHE
ncbi:pimeloyl-ACP methyl ester carboxylesterase [Deinobacterium chartae]|uniref:Pimeloyl-ACP methyl ester carboxylesterase n=1 Tax=Deinobacterium chartae TaxID=521158 RepID=A0A841HZ89_9DEIO|nr:alpha/beta fold hydrolase [Deinobacterium chartae]MBB6098851.1 pimeloyl-ACP methyl ester carboxylesterase [Deinobacterium chartae]